MEIKKEHWVRNLTANEELIVNNLIQIEMAKNIIELCKIKISEFSEQEKSI